MSQQQLHAAIPPPADPLYEYCPSCRRLGPLFGLTAIRSEETGGRHCISCFGKTESRLLPLWTAPPTPADPPALVALVREWQEVMELWLNGKAETRADVDAAETRLLAYLLPAAPPVTDTPQGWPDGNNPVRWKPRPDCVIGVYCQRHGFIHGQEAEELRERLEELGSKAVNRVLDEVDARDSLAYLEATNEPTPPDAAPAAPPQEGR